MLPSLIIIKIVINGQPFSPPPVKNTPRPGAGAWELGTSDLSPGIYILRLAAGGAAATAKVAVVK